MKKIYSILVCMCILASFVACEKDKEFVLTTLSVTGEMLAPTYEAATIQCKLSADATISEAYVHYSLTSSFEDYKEVKMELVHENYSVLLLNLADNTTYYIRYKVSNKYSQVMSKSVNSFKTERLTTPTVLLGPPSEIQETQAKVVMSVVYDGGCSVTEMGVCWSTSSNPTKQNFHTRYDGFAIDAVLEITDLQPNTTYYVRAYAVNKVGVAYSEERSFTTLSDVQLPTLSTSTIAQITETSAVAGGNVTSDGNASVTERGVVYSTNPNPVITNLYNTIKPCGSGTGSFTCDLTNLQPNTTYYVRAYATNSMGTAYGEEVSFTTEEEETVVSDPTGTENGYGYVDLGLSVKWATCNVGASSPEEYGDYFAWGETEPKEVYDWSTYKYCNGSSSTLTKYNTFISRGTVVDHKTQLELSDDVAHANWGGSWRMPTDAELTELCEQCTWTWTTQNGVYGYKVTSKKSGYTNKSIFLPAAGCRYDSSLYDAGSYGIYWSSLLVADYPDLAWHVVFISDLVDGSNNSDRYNGLSVRPVLGESEEEVTDPTVTTAAITQITETSAVAGGNVTSDGNASVTERGVVYSTNPNPVITNLYNTIKPCGSGTGSFTCNLTGLQANTTYYVRAYAINSKGTAYGTQVTFTTSKSVVLPTVTTSTVTQIMQTTAVAGGTVTSDGNAGVTERGVVYSTNPNPVITNLYNTIKPCGSGTGSFTCDLTNLQPNTTYYVRAYATNEMGTAYGEEISFTTKEESNTPNNGTENGYAYVDLGLSVKWATCNVGASQPEEYGDYFAWGETQPTDYYDWSTYKWCNGSHKTHTKYCTDSYFGTVDNKTTLEMSDDAAHANWGGSWRMPTKAEQDELYEQCNWTWTSQNGVYGYKVTSNKNGNSIFLPAAGFRNYSSSLQSAGSKGYYWSSMISPMNSLAYVLDFTSDSVSRADSGRCFGNSVRPVCP